ncbi:hypothetical protein [Burkholderia cenocepacia]|uniref:hypothetical protein n=1 Tax=Burkholderia cenocepacia TaxID=95486 RepID=UPI00076DB247|nr:hypothetical protein [Burkholderia cenocepacia]KWU26402.1 hypothetical protein AS149_25785 [Burkholderia cenocepacia]
MTQTTDVQHVPAANPFGEPGFEVRAPCGRTYFVPLAKVRADYADFLVQADQLSEAAALEKAKENESFLSTWFSEQFDWSDVERNGRVVSEASPEQVKRALDFLRDYVSSAPCNDYTPHEIPG